MKGNTVAAILGAAAVAVVVALACASPSRSQTVTPISGLPAITTPLGRDALVPVVQSSQTRKATVGDIYNPASPGNLGATTPGSAKFTDLDLSGTITGAGLSNYLAAPPTIGGSTPGLAFFSTLTAQALSVSGSVSGAGFTSLITSQFASPPALGSTAPAPVTGTTVSATTKVNGATGLQVAGVDLCSSTLPTVLGTGFGTSPSVSASSSCAMDITVGTSPAAAAGTITLPAAPHGWVCTGTDITTKSTTVALLQQNGGSTTTALIQNYTDVMGTGTAWTAADHLRVMCLPW